MNAPMTPNEGLVVMVVMVGIMLMPLLMEWVMVRKERRGGRAGKVGTKFGVEN